MRVQREATIHQHVCDYMRLQHRTVHFRTDFAAGIKMTMAQAIKHKRLQSGRAWPDLFIALPRNGYCGLFLELKEPGARIYLKNGSLSTEKHVQEQAEVLNELNGLGFRANFAVGFDDAIRQIDEYLA